MVFRVLGTWSLLVSVIALVVDVTRSMSADTLVMTRLGEHWFQLNAASLNAAQAAVQRYVLPALWDPVILTLLKTPTWIVFAVLGILLLWIGRRRERPDVYVN